MYIPAVPGETLNVLSLWTCPRSLCCADLTTARSGASAVFPSPTHQKITQTPNTTESTERGVPNPEQGSLPTLSFSPLSRSRAVTPPLTPSPALVLFTPAGVAAASVLRGGERRHSSPFPAAHRGARLTPIARTSMAARRVRSCRRCRSGSRSRRGAAAGRAQEFGRLAEAERRRRTPPESP